MKLLNHYFTILFVLLLLNAQIFASDRKTVTAVPANNFLNTIGVNTSINSRGENIDSTIKCAKYLGVRWFRSGPPNQITPLSQYQRLYKEAGIHFSCGLGSGRSAIDNVINGAKELAGIEALLAIEGNNETNNWGIVYEGESGGGHEGHSWIPIAKLHRDLYKAVKTDPVLKKYPVWGVSEPGAEIDNAGLQYLSIPQNAKTLMADGTQYADYANVHNYFIHPNWPGIHNNQTWQSADPTKSCPIDGLYGNFGLTWGKKYPGYSENKLINLPRVTTETGTTIEGSMTEELQARMYMSVYLDQFKRGWSYTAIYILRDRSDEEGNQTFGFYKPDYRPRKAAHYLHNLTTILSDNKSIKLPGKLVYAILGQTENVHDLLLQKNNGSFELIVWGERYEGGSDQIKVNFNKPFRKVKIYNPIVATEAMETLNNVRSVSLTVTNHPYVIEIDN